MTIFRLSPLESSAPTTNCNSCVKLLKMQISNRLPAFLPLKTKCYLKSIHTVQVRRGLHSFQVNYLFITSQKFIRSVTFVTEIIYVLKLPEIEEHLFICGIIFQYLIPFPQPQFGTHKPSSQKYCLEILTLHWLRRQNEIDAPHWSFKTWDIQFCRYTFSFQNLADMQRRKAVL